MTAVLVHQPARGEGYRANVDALHLARFAAAGGRCRVAFDLGAGAGLVGLTLLEANAVERVVFVEIDPEAAGCADRNLGTHGWSARGDVVVGDVVDVARRRRGEAQLVVCNPPYVEAGRGRTPAEPRRARARVGSLEHFVEAARCVAGRRARACFVYPAHELVALVTALRAVGFESKRLRAVHSAAGRPARVVLVEAKAGKSGGLVVEPPLVETATRAP